MSDDLVLKDGDVKSFNAQFELLKQGCDSLLLEFDHLAEFVSPDDITTVYRRITEIGLRYNAQVEIRKKMCRLLDLARNNIMAPENKVAAELKKWRAQIERFQKEQRRLGRERIRPVVYEEQSLLQEIESGVRACQCELEGLVVDQRKALVKNSSELIRQALKNKSAEIFTQFITSGVRAKITRCLSPILEQMPERVRGEVKYRIMKDPEYGTESLLFRLEHEAENILIGCVGYQGEWQILFEQAEQCDSLDKIIRQVEKEFKKVYPDSELAYSNRKERSEGKINGQNMRAAISNACWLRDQKLSGKKNFL